MKLRNHVFGWPWPRRSLLRKRQRPALPRRPRGYQPSLEPLERRNLLTFAWTALPVPPTTLVPSGEPLGTMLLLSDGTVMVHDDGVPGSTFPGAGWLRLTPDASGNYFDGTWSALTPMAIGRAAFASDVLPNGEVFVAGGEYATDATRGTESSSGEIFDPTNVNAAGQMVGSWEPIGSFTQQLPPNFQDLSPPVQIGDAMSEILADRQVLVGPEDSGYQFIYNPDQSQWSVGPKLPNFDLNDEEGWVKLPDGSILDYELQGTDPGTFVRLIPGPTDAQDQWIPALAPGSALPPFLGSLGANPGSPLALPQPELGPGVLLPDGNVFWIGADSNTVLYTPPTTLTGTGSWTSGPNILYNFGGFDAPAAVEPDGNVLFAVSPPVNTGDGYPGPTAVLEYNPTTNLITDTACPDPHLTRSQGPTAASDTHMLVLPNGDILFSDDSSQLWDYHPASSPENGWRPTITSISNDEGTFTLTGTQLNGLDEGATYGDDAQMASNYPIIEVTNAAQNVSFARTFDWSSTWVATGSTPESTQFTLPATVTPGVYTLSVIANGIASQPVLFVQMGAGVNSVTLRVKPGDDTTLQVLNAGSVLAAYSFSAFPGGVMVAGTAGPNSLTLDLSNGNPIPLTGSFSYDGGGSGEILVTGATALTSAFEGTGLYLTNAGTVLSPVTLSRVDEAVLTGGPSGNDFVFNGWSGVALVNGQGGTNTLNVTAPAGVNVSVTGSAVTFGATAIEYSTIQSLDVFAGGSGGDTFTLSPAAHDLDELPAAVMINGDGNSTTVFDDQSNPSTLPTTWSVSGTSVARSYNTIAVVNGRVVETTTTVTVNYSGLSALTLNSSADSTLTLSPGAHNLNELPAAVTINGGGASAAVFDDQNNTPELSSAWSVSGASVTRSDLLALGVGHIVVTATRTLTYSGLSALTLNGGPKGAFTLSPVLENLNELPATLTLNGGPSSTAVFDDQNDQPAVGATWTVNSTNVSRSSGSGGVIFSGLSGLTLNTDSRGDVVNVNITHTSGYNLTIHGGTGINTLNLDEVLGDRGGPFNPNPAPQDSGTVSADYAAPGLVSTFTYTNMEIVNQLPDPDKSFVQALYHVALGRDATQAELDQWAAQIPTLGREGVARAINQLPEAYDHVITVDYQTYLHEAPPVAEKARLEKLLERGATEEEVLADILGSDAFFQQATQGQDDEHESADVRYIEVLFQDLLGYQEDQLSNRELHHWLRELDEVGRRGVALELLTSEPYRTRAITAYFSTILHETQPPSAAEVDRLADSSKNLLEIQIELEGSAEFYRNGR
jgi:hypothetical protein